MHFVSFGVLPDLDERKRPVAYFGTTIHDQCYRRPFYDQGKFAKSFDDEGARQGWCLFELGCKGPVTHNACASLKWNGGTSFPIESGHGCIGCSEPDFWDKGGFYTSLAGGSGVSLAGIGIAAAVGIAGGAAAAIGARANPGAAERYGMTTMLDFARGPALRAASLIMIGGIVWRLSGVLLLRRRPQHAASRASLLGRVGGGVALVFTRSIPRRTFWPRIGASMALSTVFHFGFIAILVGGAPHILVIHAISGLIWPNLPKGIVVLLSGLTLAALIGLLVRRIFHPVLRLLSTADDYLSWFVVFLPVLSGILLSGETVASYETLLALHILSVELLMIWLPFGKLMHGALVFVGRGAMGFNFARKGAAT